MRKESTVLLGSPNAHNVASRIISPHSQTRVHTHSSLQPFSAASPNANSPDNDDEPLYIDRLFASSDELAPKIIAPTIHNQIFNSNTQFVGHLIPQYLDRDSVIKYLRCNKKSLYDQPYKNSAQTKEVIEKFKESFAKTPLGKLILKTIPADATPDTVPKNEWQKLSRCQLFQRIEAHLLAKNEPIFNSIKSTMNPILKPQTSFFKIFSTKESLWWMTRIFNLFAPLVFIRILDFSFMVGLSPWAACFVLLFFIIMPNFPFITTVLERQPLIILPNLRFTTANISPLHVEDTYNTLTKIFYWSITITIVSIFITPLLWMNILGGLALLFSYARAWTTKKDLKCFEELLLDLELSSQKDQKEFAFEYNFLLNSLSLQEKIQFYKQIELFKGVLTSNHSASALSEK